MTPATLSKLQKMTARQLEIQTQLTAPQVIAEQNKFRRLCKELAELNPVVDAFVAYREAVARLEETREMLHDDDDAIGEMAAAEVPGLEAAVQAKTDALNELLLPKDERDSRNVFLEIRAGTGGDEAAIFAGDLFRMYFLYAETRGWRVEVLSRSEGEHGGYKEIISRVSGDSAYAYLKFESGAHRVQRVPETESQGRIHTSACTVAVLAEAEEVDAIDINAADLRVDTFRASGAGGQHVNKTDSAIRIKHLPSGITVECQDERSQHKNRARAMAMLRSRLLEAEVQKQRREEASTRKSLVGSGDRSERIRTYNYPQGRVTDHRIGLTLYKLDDILAGQVAQVIDPLRASHRADLLAADDG